MMNDNDKTENKSWGQNDNKCSQPDNFLKFQKVKLKNKQMNSYKKISTDFLGAAAEIKKMMNE